MDPWEVFREIWIQIRKFSFKKMHLKFCLQNGCHFVEQSICSSKTLTLIMAHILISQLWNYELQNYSYKTFMKYVPVYNRIDRFLQSHIRILASLYLGTMILVLPLQQDLWVLHFMVATYLIGAGGSIFGSVNWVITGSGNGLAPNRRQAITWTNDDLLSIGPSEINFSGI